MESFIEVQTTKPDSQAFQVGLSGVETVAALKKAVATHLGMNSFRLVASGQIVADNDDLNEVKRKGVAGPLLAIVMSQRPRSQAPASTYLEGSADEDNDLNVRLPANAPLWKQKLISFCRRWHVPELLLYIFLSIKWTSWAKLLAFIALAPVAHRLGIGPIYILAVIVIVLFRNLGTRKAGEASAYSIYNNFRALPGQLTADEVDRQVRTGQA